MRSKQATGAFWMTTLIGILITSIAMTADPPTDTASQATASETPKNDDDSGTEKRVSIETARDRAKLTHTICCAMLDVIHENYFRNERSVVPSVAMEDAFPKIAMLENVSLRWITVNGKTMNVDHDPETEFEKRLPKRLPPEKKNLN